ncbi:hypothetical protein BTA51_19645 [Hahella sp. CCB-MM4]|uniref:hypothetical protein n=1 Tax=Hahella sp. (strain CCB-MM4) TaxID=1926491 RepID=UPI000B9BCF06|nr:hypothetical protein [Hahella sp. CCB-MM4]OZG71837.1 hypothetical protein BTA51_19645 [Hahella sp. CCB-MM4]
MKRISVAVLIFISTYVFADFKCQVKESMTLSDTGVMDRTSNVAKINNGKEFTVNRSTGIITGGGFTNNMSGTSPRVLDVYEPSENSYKAITIYEPNYTVDYLEIKEYVKGDKKPFIFKGAWGSIITGVCSYY